MTEAACIKEEGSRGRAGVFGLVGILGIGAFFYLSVFMSDEIGGYVFDGMKLAVTKVLPTALPFMLLSDAFRALVNMNDIPLIGWLGRACGLPAVSAAALLPGNACGFPLGGKLTGEMYRDGVISKEAAERLLAYSSNPSPPFVLAVVGSDMLGDKMLGVMLLLCIYLSTFISAQLFRAKYENIKITYNNIGQSYNFVSSVKSAASSCIPIVGFISVFSAVVGIIKNHVNLPPFSTLLIAVTEVTSASDYFAKCTSLPEILSVAMIGFSLAFGGLSVFFQTAAFAGAHGLGMGKYLKIKLSCGLICSALSALGYRLFFA